MDLLRNAIFMLVIASAAPNEKRKKGKMAHTQRLVGGNEVHVEDYPYVVMMGHRFTSCTGSILNATHILTACHCVVRQKENNKFSYKKAEGYKIIAGANHWNDMSSFRQEATVKRFIPHPQCEGNVKDVALIEMNSKLKFNTRVRPISLVSLNKTKAIAEQERLKKENVQCVSIGYGVKQFLPEIKSSQSLKAGKGTLLTDKQCEEQICKPHHYKCREAAFALHKWSCIRSKESSHCVGDSGGPVVCKGMIFGIISSGDANCTYDGLQLVASLEPVLDLVNGKVEFTKPQAHPEKPDENHSQQSDEPSEGVLGTHEGSFQGTLEIPGVKLHGRFEIPAIRFYGTVEIPHSLVKLHPKMLDQDHGPSHHPPRKVLSNQVNQERPFNIKAEIPKVKFHPKKPDQKHNYASHDSPRNVHAKLVPVKPDGKPTGTAGITHVKFHIKKLNQNHSHSSSYSSKLVRDDLFKPVGSSSQGASDIPEIKLHHPRELNQSHGHPPHDSPKQVLGNVVNSKLSVRGKVQIPEVKFPPQKHSMHKPAKAALHEFNSGEVDPKINLLTRTIY